MKVYVVQKVECFEGTIVRAMSVHTHEKSAREECDLLASREGNIVNGQLRNVAHEYKVERVQLVVTVMKRKRSTRRG